MPLASWVPSPTLRLGNRAIRSSRPPLASTSPKNTASPSTLRAGVRPTGLLVSGRRESPLLSVVVPGEGIGDRSLIVVQTHGWRVPETAADNPVNPPDEWQIPACVRRPPGVLVAV